MAYTQKKIQIIQKTGEGLVQMMPETTATQVVSTATGKVTATNVDAAIAQIATEKVLDANKIIVTPKTGVLIASDVQAALEEIAGAAASGGVTSVNGATGAVTLEASDVKAEPTGAVSAHNKASDAHSDIRQIANNAKDSAKEANDAIGVINGKLPGMETNITNAQTKADQAYSLAEGRARAVSFATEKAMKDALPDAKQGEYKVGDNLFIEEVNVPDYWISKVSTSKNLTYGYYDISVLESQKVDLDAYQKKTDNTLKTTSKQVVGAINEVKGVADAAKSTAENQASTISTLQQNVTTITGTTIPALEKTIGTAQSAAEQAQTDATTANTAITNIVTNGTTTVKKAEQATSSDKLTKAQTIELTGPITGTIDTDFSKKASIATTIGDGQITSAKLANVTTAQKGMSAFNVNAQGQITAAQRIIEFGTDTPSAELAVGGLFFKEIQ